jgi:hypothetical protein
MSKLLTVMAATFLALTALLGSGAEAAFNLRIKSPESTVTKAGCGGGGGYARAYRPRYAQSRRAKRSVDVAERKESKPQSVAKAEPVAQPEVAEEAAQSENSSIAESTSPVQKVSEAKPAKPEQKIAAVKEPGCKKFFPSVGMTLSVPCE